MQLYSALAEHYFAIEAPGRDFAADVVALSTLLRKAGARRILDAGCGTGEHVAALWKRGFDVTGIDRAPRMIAVARARFPERAPHLHTCDWDHFGTEQPFDALTCLYGSIGYRLSDRRLLRTLEAFRRLLRPGGMAIVELWNAQPLLAVDSVPLRPVSAADWNGVRMARYRSVRLCSRRPAVVELRYQYRGADRRLTDRHWVRAFRPEEWLHLAERAGFRARRLASAWDSSIVSPGSIRMLATLVAPG